MLTPEQLASKGTEPFRLVHTEGPGAVAAQMSSGSHRGPAQEWAMQGIADDKQFKYTPCITPNILAERIRCVEMLIDTDGSPWGAAGPLGGLSTPVSWRPGPESASTFTATARKFSSAWMKMPTLISSTMAAKLRRVATRRFLGFL